MERVLDQLRRPIKALPRIALCALLAGGMVCQPAIAAPALTAQQQADKAAILDFPLSMDVIERLAQVSRESAAAHVACTDERDLQGARSLDAMAHTLEIRRPRAVPILARHGFTPKQFLTASSALITTRIAADTLARLEGPFADMFKKEHDYSDQNLAFYQAHREEIAAVMKQLDKDDESCGG